MEVTRKRTLNIVPLTYDYRRLETYQPERLLNMLHEVLQVTNDAKLANELKIEPSTISKIRNRWDQVTPALLLRMHDVSGLTIENLRDLAGIPQWMQE